MTDAFEHEMQAIALTAAANGEKVPVSAVLKAVVALNDALSKEIQGLAENQQAAMANHCSENMHMTHHQFEEFVRGRDKMLELTVERIDSPHRVNDEEGSNFALKRRDGDVAEQTFFMWTLGGKLWLILMVVMTTFITMFMTEYVAFWLGWK